LPCEFSFFSAVVSVDGHPTGIPPGDVHFCSEKYTYLRIRVNPGLATGARRTCFS